MESARPDALFHDRFAAPLAGRLGQEAPKGVPPWPMIVRTRLIDDLVVRAVQEGVDCVVNLAAGLDTRPYRLSLPSTLRWVEADYPAMIDFKESALAGEKPACDLRRERVDLADDGARRAALSRALQGSSKALVITEGLLVYLTEAQVRALAADLLAQPAVKQWIIDIASPGILKRMQKATSSRLDESERMKFAPASGVAFYESLGFRVRDLQSMYRAAVAWKRVPFFIGLFRFFPEPDPRKLDSRPWGAVVRLER
jgi:methyltransferase (TIGR00027 family)